MAKKMMSLVEFLDKNNACATGWVEENYRKGFRYLYDESSPDDIFWLATTLGLTTSKSFGCGCCTCNDVDPKSVKKRFTFSKVAAAFEKARRNVAL